MIINTVTTKAQISKISRYISDLQNTRNKILSLKAQISSNWTADEVRYINNALDKVATEISEATRLMDRLVIDVRRALDKVEKEELNKGN